MQLNISTQNQIFEQGLANDNSFFENLYIFGSRILFTNILGLATIIFYLGSSKSYFTIPKEAQIRKMYIIYSSEC